MTTLATHTLQEDADAILQAAVRAEPGVPGVVAMVTDRAGTLYRGAAGRRRLDGAQPMTDDTVFALFSTTKAITATAVLQLVEDGRVDLDAPAERYAPALGAVQVLEGFGDDGAPRLRAPRRAITTRMLLLHTAGFGYDFFNPHYRRLAEEQGQPSVITATRAALQTPLLFDPGEGWEYGTNMDWAGQVVEGASGQPLGTVMAERIFAPLGMADSGFALTPSMQARLAAMHQRDADGTLAPLDDFVLPQEPEVQMGGHGLYSTVPDYMKFIRMWLNDGAGDHGRVLKPETVRMAAADGLGERSIHPLPGVIPALSNDAEFFPGMDKGWGLSFMINRADAPTGRPAGSLAWAGLANLYYWIDRKNGLGGFWATQILPFADPASVEGYLAFETAAYRAAGL